LQESLEEFKARGIRIVDISVDPAEITREHARKQGYTFTFLADENAEAIRRYDLLHEGAAPGGHDISRPAEFLIDTTGTVQWVNLTDNYRVRLRPTKLFEVLDNLRQAWDIWKLRDQAPAEE
jgi:peroxiredoxin